MSKKESNNMKITGLIKVKITKISDDFYEGNHPNGINEGFTKTGLTPNKPTIGERFFINGTFSTSPVTRYVDDNTFKTTYSTYKIEYLD